MTGETSLTVAESARLVSMSPDLLTRLCDEGRLPARMVDESWCIEIGLLGCDPAHAKSTQVRCS